METCKSLSLNSYGIFPKIRDIKINDEKQRRFLFILHPSDPNVCRSNMTA